MTGSSDVNHRIVPVFMAVQPEGQEITNILYCVAALSLVHRDFPKLSECFDNIINCTGDKYMLLLAVFKKNDFAE